MSKKLCIILLVCMTGVQAQRFPAFQKLVFGSNISTELYLGTSPYLQNVLPDAEANVVYSWIEPIFEDKSSFYGKSFLKFSADFTQSPWYSRLGGHLGFKLTQFFEFNIGYTSLFYWNSNVELGKYENQIHRWNTEEVRERIYENDNNDIMQSVDSKARLIFEFSRALLIAEVQHILIDIKTESDAYNYDYYYGIPVYKKDQLVNLNIDFRYMVPQTSFDIIVGNRYVSKGFQKGIWERYKDEGMFKSVFKIGSIYHCGTRAQKERIVAGLDLVIKHSEYLNPDGRLIGSNVTGNDTFYFFLAYQKDFSFLDDLF